MPERPRGRERGEIKGSGGVNLKGSGLGTGPKGAKDGYSGRPSGDRPGGTGSSGGGTGSSGGGRQTRGSGGGGVSPLVFLIILVVAFLGGGKAGVLDMLTGGGSGSSSVATTPQQDYQYQQTYGTGHYAAEPEPTQAPAQTSQQGTAAGNQTQTEDEDKVSLYDYINAVFGGDPYTYTEDQNTVTEDTGTNGGEGALDTTVAAGVREKRTKIIGKGKDTVTLMIYMCGTDLESRNGMATADLQEMASANLGNINVIVYTGGTTKWHTDIISTRSTRYRTAG